MAIFNAESIGHACAVVGLDEGEGTLLLHDPAHASPVEFLIEEVGQAYAPLGVLGIAILPAPLVDVVAEWVDLGAPND